MLNSLTINNIALITKTALEFGGGLNVLTGETGAGKSMILGSLSLIMGEKPKASIIRSGESSASVEAVFSVDVNMAEWLETEHDIEVEDGELLVVRSLRMGADGSLKSVCRVGGVTVTAGVLKDIVSRIVHIHGQHDTLALLKPKNHINILDEFGGNAVAETLSRYHAAHSELGRLNRELSKFGGSDDERERQLDIYKYQVNEIEGANLSVDEEEKLIAKRKIMQNFQRVSESIAQVSAYLNSDDGAVSLFARAVSALLGVSDTDERLDKIYEMADSASYALNDVGSMVEDYLDGMHYDEEEFERVDERIDEIKKIKRKYGGSIESALEFCEKTQGEINKLESATDEIERITKAIASTRARLLSIGGELSNQRKSLSSEFSDQILSHLGDLGMGAAMLTVSVVSSADVVGEEDYSENMAFAKNGLDTVEFLFTANAGEPLRPLDQIASGGELSRFMLALRSIMSESGGAQTMIFDEIDTGIGGTMGVQIARKIANLSRSIQILAVTHLPQIAAAGGTHFFIEKKEVGGRTETSVKLLGSEESLSELGRMMGGVGGTSIEHAKTLKNMFVS